MNQDKLLGLVRELLSAASAAFIAHGVGSDILWQQVAGTIIAGMSLYWGVKANEGWAILSSVLRKMLSMGAGVAAYLGWMTPEKADSMVSVLMAIGAIAWSMRDKPGDNPTPPAVNLLLVFLFASCLLLTACGGQFRWRVEGPHGTARIDKRGDLIVTPRPLRIPNR